MAVIYGLVDPADATHIRYIGVTLNLDRRRNAYNAWQFTNKRVLEWADGLKAQGRKPALVVLDIGRPEREAEFISDYKARGHKLLNVVPGRKTARDIFSHFSDIGVDTNLILAAREQAKRSHMTFVSFLEYAIRQAIDQEKRSKTSVAWGPLDTLVEVHGTIEETLPGPYDDAGDRVHDVLVIMQEDQPFILQEDLVKRCRDIGMEPFEARRGIDQILRENRAFLRGGGGTISKLQVPP